MSFICSIAILSSLLPGCQTGTSESFPGYIEGEYASIAPVATARIKQVRVRRGEKVVPGTILATLDNEDTQVGVDAAEGRVAEAQAQLENLRKGRRTVELEAIEAALIAARAEAESAALTLDRQQSLRKRGVAAQANVDTARAADAVARGKVSQLEANLAEAQMPARDDEVMAAEARLAQSRSALAEARWKHQQRVLVSETRGRVYDVIRRSGEIAGPSQPVVSVLPDGAALIRFYVPEASLFNLGVGAQVNVICDGCPADLSATISYSSSEPEFTPPVIYSNERRDKLVFLVEARPDAGSAQLQPGQIVSVAAK
jgi:HlyD family secretion protein